MPTDEPFFLNLRPVKKVVTPKGQMLIRKECKCGNEFLGPDGARNALRKQNGNE